MRLVALLHALEGHPCLEEVDVSGMVGPREQAAVRLPSMPSLVKLTLGRITRRKEGEAEGTLAAHRSPEAEHCGDEEYAVPFLPRLEVLNLEDTRVAGQLLGSLPLTFFLRLKELHVEGCELAKLPLA